jgi:8-oxo-dGTP pyrophosphatase MutT (NUDIX family)
MTVFQELSAGVIPYRWVGERVPHYLVLHSATVRNPRARWEFPKGGIEPGESPRQAAVREFLEETSLHAITFRDDFERSLSYTYIRKGSKVLKTVTYFLVEVQSLAGLTCSAEHVADVTGHWHHWGSFEQISRLLYHAKIRQLFAEADAWIHGNAEVGMRNAE